jgi:hypothetical protein
VESDRIMQEESFAETEEKKPFDRLTQKTAFVVLLLVVPIYFAFDHAGYPGRGRVAAICAAMIMASAWMRWDLKNRVWFWATIAFLILLHVPLVLLIPWTDHSYPGVVLMPEALLDLAVTYGVIKLVESLAKVLSREQQSV